MPSVSIKEFNRTAFATLIPSEGNTYTAIELDRRSEAIAIHSLCWGSQVRDSTDRTNYTGHWIAILRNISLSSDSSFSSAAPVGLPAGCEILWMDFRSALGGETNKVFPEPFILPGGDTYLIVSPAPGFSAGVNSTVYYHVSLNAELLPTTNSVLGWSVK